MTSKTTISYHIRTHLISFPDGPPGPTPGLTPVRYSTRQVAMQTVADITSLLGKVNRDITLKRKTMIRPALKGDFKTLSTSTTATENLFGDNLTQAIKDIQVKRKIEDPSSLSTSSRYSHYNRRGQRGGSRYYGNSNNYSGNFLWRGRGRGRYHHRASHHHQSHQHQQSGQKKH